MTLEDQLRDWWNKGIRTYLVVFLVTDEGVFIKKIPTTGLRLVHKVEGNTSTPIDELRAPVFGSDSGSHRFRGEGKTPRTEDPQ
jgi:hypothetical protein